MILVTRPCDFPSCNRESRGPGNEATIALPNSLIHMQLGVCSLSIQSAMGTHQWNAASGLRAVITNQLAVIPTVL